MTTHTTHTKRGLAVASRKGGVGKTTTATILAAELADRGLRVLLADLDPQAHSTSQAGLTPARGEQGTHLVIAEGAAIADVVARSRFGYDVLTSGHDVTKADEHIRAERGEEFRLRDALAACATPYDAILIDCPGFITHLAIAGLIASRSVLVPVPLEHLAVDGLAQTYQAVQRLRGYVPDLRIGAALAMRVDLRTDNARLLHAELTEKAGGILLRGTLRQTVSVPASQKAGMPITHYAPKSPVAEDCRRVVTELLERGLFQ